MLNVCWLKGIVQVSGLKWGCMNYLPMVSVLASVDDGQFASSNDRALSCERTQVKSYFIRPNKVLPKKTISVKVYDTMF